MLAILIGPPGAGKSRLAPSLAAALGTRAQDLDRLIEAAARRPITDIFRDEGEAGFRTRERAMLLDVVASSGILATGGGVVVDPANRALLRASGTVVFLAASPTTQRARLAAPSADARPLLSGASDLAARLGELYAARLPLYRATAHIELTTDGRGIDELVAELLPLLRPGAPSAR